MKVYSLRAFGKGIERAAKLWPNSYVRIFRIWFGYNLVLVRIVKTSEEKENDTINHSS